MKRVGFLATASGVHIFDVLILVKVGFSLLNPGTLLAKLYFETPKIPKAMPARKAVMINRGNFRLRSHFMV